MSIKTIKIEIKLNKYQIDKCNRNFGILRYLYNEFIATSVREYNTNKHFVFGYDFDKYVNNTLSLEKPWIKECSSKARKDTIMNADKTLRKFFKGVCKFPRFKSKKDKVQSFFFIKDAIHYIDASHISIPILKKIKLKERGYLKEYHIPHITSGRVIKEGHKWYVSLYVKDVDIKDKYIPQISSNPLGIDMGVKHYATIYNGDNITKIDNINKCGVIGELEYKITELQKAISNKMEINKRNLGYKLNQNIKKGDATKIYRSNNIIKLQRRINKYYTRMTNIKIDFIKKLCNALVRTKPKYITIEDLSISNMLKYSSSSLADKIQKCMFNYFKFFLNHKCNEYNVELRIANKYFASSKLCCVCGYKNKDIKLSTRIYKCEECGNTMDRDDNAAINLYNLQKYSLAVE